MADEPTATKEIPAALSGPSSSLAGLRILVTGLGVTGFPAAVHLGERGADVIVIDGDATADVSEKAQILEVFDVDIRRGPEHVEALPEGELDLVVTSPGWRPDQPVLAAAAEAGIPVIGEVELAWRIRGTNDAKWLAITGTNGKTTTTTMLESMLLAAGLKAKACGNIGTPLLEAVLEPGLEVLAIELSSFQLHWQESMSADAAAVLNIAPDHLDWHGSAEAYAADKAKIFHNAKLACVYNSADEVTLHMVEDADVIEGAKAIGFTGGVPHPGELGVVEDLLVDRAFIPQRYSSAAELASLDDVAAATGVAGSRPAPHQIANALAAACLARAIDVPGQAISAGLRSHSLGAHRMVTVAEADGIRWVDDSKATNTHAANASWPPSTRSSGSPGTAQGRRLHFAVRRPPRPTESTRAHRRRRLGLPRGHRRDHPRPRGREDRTGPCRGLRSPEAPRRGRRRCRRRRRRRLGRIRRHGSPGARCREHGPVPQLQHSRRTVHRGRQHAPGALIWDGRPPRRRMNVAAANKRRRVFPPPLRRGRRAPERRLRRSTRA